MDTFAEKSIQAAARAADLLEAIYKRIELEYDDRKARGESTIFPCAAFRQDIVSCMFDLRIAAHNLEINCIK